MYASNPFSHWTCYFLCLLFLIILCMRSILLWPTSIYTSIIYLRQFLPPSNYPWVKRIHLISCVPGLSPKRVPLSGSEAGQCDHPGQWLECRGQSNCHHHTIYSHDTGHASSGGRTDCAHGGRILHEARLVKWDTFRIWRNLEKSRKILISFP